MLNSLFRSGKSVKRRCNPLKWIVEIICWNVTLLNLLGCERSFGAPFCFCASSYACCKAITAIPCEIYSVENIFSLEMLHEKKIGCACHEKMLIIVQNNNNNNNNLIMLFKTLLNKSLFPCHTLANVNCFLKLLF